MHLNILYEFYMLIHNCSVLYYLYLFIELLYSVLRQYIEITRFDRNIFVHNQVIQIVQKYDFLDA